MNVKHSVAVWFLVSYRVSRISEKKLLNLDRKIVNLYSRAKDNELKMLKMFQKFAHLRIANGSSNNLNKKSVKTVKNVQTVFLVVK